jgi:integrase
MFHLVEISLIENNLIKEIITMTKTKKLTDAICRDLPRLDNRYYKPGDYPGLEFWVLPTGKKTWKFQYRVKGKRFPFRKKLGNYPAVGVVEANKKARQIATQIFNGVDPREEQKSDVLKMQLGEAIRQYYLNDLTTVNQHRPNTIKNIKAIFGPWIFRNTFDKNILSLLGRVEDIQYKKLSSITPKMFKELFQLCGSRSPIVANRLQNYLRKFWNDFVKDAENPFILKKKFMNQENVYLDFLDPTELKRVMKVLIQIDNRTGRLDMNYYKKNILNPVSCCLIAFLLATGRRTDEAASLTWDRFLQGDNPRIKLIESKTSKKNNKLIFNIGDEAKTTLQLIQNDRLNNNQSKFYFPIDDPRNKQIFPSKDYGRKLKNGVCKTLYVKKVETTWNKVLKLGGVERHMKVYATRHTFATNFYRVTRDIKALAEALGTTEQIALKYAKLVGNTVVEGINKIEFFENNNKTVLKDVTNL